MKKIILLLSIFAVLVSLTGCNERDLPLDEVIDVGNFSGESLVSGELEDEEIEGVSVIRVDYYNYEEADEFAKLHGDGIEKYQITGLKDDKKQKLINDNLSNIYEETLEEYKNHISTEYLPSLNGYIMLESDELISFCLSRKWLTNNETYVNEYYTINKKTAEIMKLSDFYNNKVGFLTEISKKIYNEFEIRKENLKLEYEIDDSYFFNLTEEDFYDNILLDQGSFYISEKGELVYYFQKYEIGPGVIGPQEFVLLENIEF